MSDNEIKKLIRGMTPEKKEVAKTGLELCYFNRDDVEYIKKETTSVFEAEKLLTTKRRALAAY